LKNGKTTCTLVGRLTRLRPLIYRHWVGPGASWPVVKAVVPGMEVLGDFDDYFRVHPELYQNYLFIQAS